MKKLYLTIHARERLKERRIPFNKVLKTFDRYSYFFDNMDLKEKRNLKVPLQKDKYINAVIGKKSENSFFVVTVFSMKRGLL